MAIGRGRLLGSLGALVVLSACGNHLPTATPAQLRQASFFVAGDRTPTLLDAIRAGTDDEITFNGHYSIAFVSCGPGCGSYWFVDRRTGGVIEAPASPIEGEMTWDIATEPDSDLLKATFGPLDGSPHGCAEQQFRLGGTAFTRVGRRRPVDCPA